MLTNGTFAIPPKSGGERDRLRMWVKQYFRWYQGIKKTIACHGTIQVPEINENRTNGKTFPRIQATHFRLDLHLNFRTNAFLPLNLDKIGRPRRLDKKIDLASPATRIPLMSIRRSRLHNRTSQMQKRHKFHGMVDDQILELESHHRIPPRKILQSRKTIGATGDFLLVRLDVAEVETRIIVAYPILCNSCALTRDRADPSVGGHEAS